MKAKYRWKSYIKSDARDPGLLENPSYTYLLFAAWPVLRPRRNQCWYVHKTNLSNQPPKWKSSWQLHARLCMACVVMDGLYSTSHRAACACPSGQDER